VTLIFSVSIFLSPALIAVRTNQKRELRAQINEPVNYR